MYTVAGLEHGIVQAKTHIKTLRAAILQEEQTIASYRCMIDDIERAEQCRKEAEANITLEVDRGFSDGCDD